MTTGGSSAIGLQRSSQDHDSEEQEHDEEDGDNNGDHRSWHTTGAGRGAGQSGSRRHARRYCRGNDGRSIVAGATLLCRLHELSGGVTGILLDEGATHLAVVEDVIETIAAEQQPVTGEEGQLEDIWQ